PNRATEGTLRCATVCQQGRGEQADPQRFAGLGCQLPPGGGRTAVIADAGLEVGIIPPPGPSPLVSVSDSDGLLGAHSAPAGAAGALPEKVGGGCRGAEPPAWRAAPARQPLGKNASSVSRRAWKPSPSPDSEPRPTRRRNLRAVDKADHQRRRLLHLSQRVAPAG